MGLWVISRPSIANGSLSINIEHGVAILATGARNTNPMSIYTVSMQP